MEWSYGLTTVPARFETTLPRTLASLKEAGFEKPRLFVDGHDDSKAVKDKFGLEATCHYPNLRTFGNWITALWDIYVRNPHAHRYALFQDDFVTCLNLRSYLEAAPYPDKGYLNLYTFPANQERCPKGHIGFYPANQKGLGAVALIFTRDAVEILLSHEHMAKRPQHKTRGHKAIDGGIVDTFRKSGWKEYVHNPSLVQHIGTTSSMGNRKQPLAKSFMGEDFDCMRLLGKEKLPTPVKPKDPTARWNKFLFKEAIELCNKELPIVEIGCIRDTRPIAAKADGHSTVHWGKSGISTVTIDVDPTAIRAANKLTSQYSNVEIKHGDGFKYLEELQTQIGLLYLDGPHPRKEEGVTFSDRCYDAAINNMGVGSVLLIDDCDISPGKGDLVIPKALKDGFDLVKKDRQCLMVRRSIPKPSNSLLDALSDVPKLVEAKPEWQQNLLDEFSKSKVSPKQRIGLVGYNCSSGLGELNEQLANYLDIDLWLVKPHARYKTKPSNENCDNIICRGGDKAKIDQFLNAIDTVVFCETPYYSTLPQKAKMLGKRVVCIPMLEWTPRQTSGWMASVDLWICPTQVCYQALKKQGLPVAYLPWPTDTDVFEFQQRSTVERFVYSHGHGGFHDRKGGSIVEAALQINPDLPITVFSQVGISNQKPNSLDNPKDLYNVSNGDVLIMPHKFDGIGLSALEAKSCGMPVISTDGVPWNEFEPLDKFPSTHSLTNVKRKIHSYSVTPQNLITTLEKWIGRDISIQSSEARLWAESRSWKNTVDPITQLITKGETSNV